MPKSKPSKPKTPRLPKVSIATPTYNRAHFHPILTEIVRHQSYPHERLEWVIIDDSPEPSPTLKSLETLDGITVKYIHIPAQSSPMTVGAKRDMLSQSCSGKYIVNMDDDDYYTADRVANAVKALEEGYSIVGNSEMYIYFTDIQKYYKFGPYSDNHATGATLAYSKSYAETHKWGNGGFGEESNFTKGCKMGKTPIGDLLALSHNSNTVDKSPFLNPKYGQVGKRIVRLESDPVGLPNPVKSFYRTLCNNPKVANVHSKEIIAKMEESAIKMRNSYDNYCTNRLNAQIAKVCAIYRFLYGLPNIPAGP